MIICQVFKRLFLTNNQIILNPINRKEVKPIIGTSNEIKVQGVVVGAIKMFNDKLEDENLSELERI